ncbi:MAG: hypothetical protein ABEJ84_08285 [Halodesulfurarchaeum sp.]
MDETETDAEEPDGDEHEDVRDERVTAPMQEFGSREVTIGFVVLAIGLLVAFVLPLAV